MSFNEEQYFNDKSNGLPDTTPLTDVDTELDKVLSGFHEAGNDNWPTCPRFLEDDGECKCEVADACIQLKALIGTIAEQIIGEDEPIDPEWGEQSVIRYETIARNELQAEQRQRLKDYMENNNDD